VIRSVFIALVPCLFAQLWVRRITEPYPAIVLPSGATLLRSHGGYVGSEITLLAEDEHGEQHPCSPSTLLGTVPSEYRRYVIRRGFGITEDRDVRSIRIPLPGGGFVLRFGHPLTPSQIEETRSWLRSSLRRTLRVDAVRIHILSYAIGTFGSPRVGGQDRTLMRRDTVELVGATP
jgi:hypothetical protein